MAFTGNQPLQVYVKGGTQLEDFYLVEQVSALGVTELIAAPGLGFQILIRQIQVQNEDTQTSNTAYLLNGANIRWRIHMPNEGDGFCMDSAPGNYWKVPDNTAFSIQLTSATAVGVSISYSIMRTEQRV